MFETYFVLGTFVTQMSLITANWWQRSADRSCCSWRINIIRLRLTRSSPWRRNTPSWWSGKSHTAKHMTRFLLRFSSHDICFRIFLTWACLQVFQIPLTACGAADRKRQTSRGCERIWCSTQVFFKQKEEEEEFQFSKKNEIALTWHYCVCRFQRRLWALLRPPAGAQRACFYFLRRLRRRPRRNPPSGRSLPPQCQGRLQLHGLRRECESYLKACLLFFNFHCSWLKFWVYCLGRPEGIQRWADPCVQQTRRRAAEHWVL